jgi:hypothetical protein
MLLINININYEDIRIREATDQQSYSLLSEFVEKNKCGLNSQPINAAG